MRNRDEEEGAADPLNAVGGGAVGGADVGAVPDREGDFRPKPKALENELEVDWGVIGVTCRLEDGI